jgi:hypothetical protein
MAPATEHVIVATPMSEFGRGVLAGPLQFFVTGEDNLRVESVNSLAGVQVAIHGRLWRSDMKSITPFRYAHTPAADRTVRRDDFSLTGGAVLNLSVFASAGAPRIGHTFVRVQIVRGLGTAAIVLGTLLQGYVTASQDIGWPGSAIESSLSSDGLPRQIVGTDPAAGVEQYETVPTGVRWELLSWYGRLTTSPVVDARLPALILQTPLYAMFLSPQPGTVGPSVATNFMWGLGMPMESVLSVATLIAGLPLAIPLLAGGIIRTQTLGMNVADDWESPVFTVREWLEVA